MKTRVLVFAIALGIAITGTAYAFYQSNLCPDSAILQPPMSGPYDCADSQDEQIDKLSDVYFPRGMIELGDMKLDVQIADTDPRQVRGLMFQEPLQYDEGMLFVFEKSNNYSIWMLNMKFPLDAIWFNENGNVIDIKTDLQPCIPQNMSCPTFTPQNDAKYILEVKSGFVEKFGIDKNSVLSLIQS